MNDAHDGRERDDARAKPEPESGPESESGLSPAALKALDAAAAALASARRVAVLTGAGVSAESKIPTFRDAMEGLWASFEPQQLATPEAFRRDPATVTKWYDHRRLGCLHAQPNAGHDALAALHATLAARADEPGWCRVITQNVDGLHARAGSPDVIELHGSITQWRCTATGKQTAPPPEPMTDFPPASPFAHGAVLRPCVVWFGEALPADAIAAADEAVHACDLFMTVGTSAVVYPAAGYIDVAQSLGVPTIEINPNATAYSSSVTHAIPAPSGAALPELLRRAGLTPDQNPRD